MYVKFLNRLFFYNTILFIGSIFIFVLFPQSDILLSNIFFTGEKFISEEYTVIKVVRDLLKNLMVIFPITVLIFLIVNFINSKQNVRGIVSKRTRFVLIGWILGPILGCGIIANLYFKDTWGRARPVHVEEFGGNKIFTPAFVKSDQCAKNCSWISGEASAAFSFLVGTILLKNHIFFILNITLGFLVFFCRLSMGGHFFSDNIFAMIFMIYLALLYKSIIYTCFKKKLINGKNSNNN